MNPNNNNNNNNNNKNRRDNRDFKREPKEFEEKVIEIKRLSKKTQGGNKISFSALVVIGDHKGKAGIGLDKAADVVSAIQKSIRVAKKNLKTIEMNKNGSIAHILNIKKGAAKIMLKPAPEGTGVIAGGSVRAVVEAFGIKNIVSKRLGSSNKKANVYATFEALTTIKSFEKKPKKDIVKDIIQKKEIEKQIKKITKTVKINK